MTWKNSINFSRKNVQSQDISNDLYFSLTPVDNAEGRDKIISALRWAVSNPQIYNIALTGPYGSGKSSVINTFINKYYPSKFKRDKKILRLSLASFDNQNQGGKKNNDNDQKSNQDNELENELEKGILKQLLYKVNAKRIPKSRYSKLHNVSPTSYIESLFVLVLSAFSVCFLFNPEKTGQRVIAYFSNFNKFLGACCLISAVFVLIFGIRCMITYIESRIALKEISFGNFSVKADGVKSDSVFDKNLDEILYFFECTKFDLVIIEDLERFNNTKVFIKLRELNNLINNNECISRKIKFIYVVRDDLFCEKDERTKFFDFIIPVIPVINSTNSAKKITELLGLDNEHINSEINADISEDYIKMVSPYLTDIRLIKNIVNEFFIYKRTLKEPENITLSDEKMFSLMIYKNKYPHDFALLEDEGGMVKEVFKGKSKAVAGIEANLKEKLNSCTNHIERIIQSEKEIKNSIMEELSGGNIDHIEMNGKNFSNEYFLKEYCHNFMDLLRQDIIVYPVNGDPVKYKAGEEGKSAEVCRLFKDYEAQIRVNSNKKALYKKDKQRIEKEIHDLNEQTIKQLIKKYGLDQVLPDNDEIRSNNLLVFLLRHGYIDEDYALYMNYFYPDTITKEELNFILSVRNFADIENDKLEIVHTKEVISRLFPNEFKQKQTLNYILTDELLENKFIYDQYLESLMDQLTDYSERSTQYIVDYLQRDSHADEFLKSLCKNNTNVWKILNDSELTDEDKAKYFGRIMTVVPIEDIINNNSIFCYQDCDEDDDYEGVIKKYFEAHEEIFDYLGDVDVEKMNEILDVLDIRFYKTDLDKANDAVFNYIIKERKYALNQYMLCQICKKLDSFFNNDFYTKNYTYLLERANGDILSYRDILSYVNENMMEYVENIVLLDDNTDESAESVKEIFAQIKYDYRNLKPRIIEHEINVDMNDV